MTDQLIQFIEKQYLRTDLPEIRPGYRVKIWQKIFDKKKTSLQAFEGIIISVRNKKSLRKMFTVRGEVAGQIVEKIFPYHSPVIEKIEVLAKGRVRRAKLFFVRKIKSKTLKKKLKI